MGWIKLKEKLPPPWLSIHFGRLFPFPVSKIYRCLSFNSQCCSLHFLFFPTSLFFLSLPSPLPCLGSLHAHAPAGNGHVCCGSFLKREEQGDISGAFYTHRENRREGRHSMYLHVSIILSVSMGGDGELLTWSGVMMRQWKACPLHTHCTHTHALRTFSL